MSQRVLITAGAAGIGREIARAFATAGATVFVCDIDAPALDRLKQEIPAVLTATCDIAKRTEIETMVADAASALGGLDVLVNNAGIAGPTLPVEELSPDDWDEVMQVNLTGTFDVTRCAIPHLKRSAAGVIITISSAAGRFGFANRSAYAATKWGLVGFTKTLSIELGQYGIRANTILPGMVAGERIERVLESRARQSGQTIEQVKERAMANQSIKRMVEPQDIASLAVFLASDGAKSISGQILPVDNDIQMI